MESQASHSRSSPARAIPAFAPFSRLKSKPPTKDEYAADTEDGGAGGDDNDNEDSSRDDANNDNSKGNNGKGNDKDREVERDNANSDKDNQQDGGDSLLQKDSYDEDNCILSSDDSLEELVLI